MKLQEWTSNPTAVASAKKLQESETWSKMMDVLADEMPLTSIPLAFGSSATDYAYAHGMQKGYEYTRKILIALGETAPEMPKEPESTFSAENRL
jgi:hypothetical protein